MTGQTFVCRPESVGTPWVTLEIPTVSDPQGQNAPRSASLKCCFCFCLSVEAVRVNRTGKGVWMLKTVGWGPGELGVSPEGFQLLAVSPGLFWKCWPTPRVPVASSGRAWRPRPRVKENSVLGGPSESWELGKLSGSVLQVGRAWTVRLGLSQRPGGKDLALQVTTWQERSWPPWGHTWQSLCPGEAGGATQAWQEWGSHRWDS